ncbi:hypothetical protein HMN09_00134200 [Mycena chlorophos]|uniref:GATA-type domain-containing protein n=1 Tax=Mycena chlorophos TaxID=658473 RepID=A0A8H6WKK8_MYCCL|nr:hypothetical protein HMN09_00134200 [Mycena chlorophos]
MDPRFNTMFHSGAHDDGFFAEFDVPVDVSALVAFSPDSSPVGAYYSWPPVPWNAEPQDSARLPPLSGLEDLRALGYPGSFPHQGTGLSVDLDLELELELQRSRFGSYTPSTPGFPLLTPEEQEVKPDITTPLASPSTSPLRLFRPPHFTHCPNCGRHVSECGQARNGCVSGKMVCSRCGQYEKRTGRVRPVTGRVRVVRATARAVSATGSVGSRVKAMTLGG